MPAEMNSVPAFVGFPTPIRFVFRETSDRWEYNPTKPPFDYAKLNRLSVTARHDEPTRETLHIGYDGSFVCLASPKVRSVEAAAALMNKVAGQLTIGGIDYRTLRPEDVVFGSVNRIGYCRVSPFHPGQPIARVLLRNNLSGPFLPVFLHNVEQVSAVELQRHLTAGISIAEAIPSLTPAAISRAVSSYASHDWSDCLLNAWMCSEQIVSHMWEHTLVDAEAKEVNRIPGRGKSLQDTRTWTAGTRLEVLFQSGDVTHAQLKLATTARKARNKLVHTGKTSGRSEAEAALTLAFSFMAACLDGELADASTAAARHYISPTSIDKLHGEPNQGEVDPEDITMHFGPLAPIPGEHEWGGQPFSKLFEGDAGFWPA